MGDGGGYMPRRWRSYANCQLILYELRRTQTERKNVRNVKNCGIEQFKEALDNFLSKVPDEPKTDGLTPGATDLISGRATNSLEYQCARRREAWDSSDFDFGQGH